MSAACQHVGRVATFTLSAFELQRQVITRAFAPRATAEHSFAEHSHLRRCYVSSRRSTCIFSVEPDVDTAAPMTMLLQQSQQLQLTCRNMLRQLALQEMSAKISNDPNFSQKNHRPERALVHKRVFIVPCGAQMPCRNGEQVGCTCGVHVS